MPRRRLPAPIPLPQDSPSDSDSSSQEQEEQEETDDDDVVGEVQEKQQQEQEQTDDDDDEEEDAEADAVEPGGRKAPISQHNSPSSSNRIAQAEEETHESDSTNHSPRRGRAGSVNRRRNSVAAAVGGKRKAFGDEMDSRKRSRKDGSSITEDDSRRPFQRLWSENDEVVILSGILDYTKRGGDPFTDYIGFFNSIKRLLHFDANLDQFKLKIRKLKKRFETIRMKAKEGEDPVLSKPHDQKLYGLYKKIWGREEGKSMENVEEHGKMKEEELKNEKSKRVEVEVAGQKLMLTWNDLVFSEGEKASTMALPSLPEKIVKEGMNLLGSSQVKELESKWRKLQISEIESYLKRLDFVHEKGILVLKALKSSYS